MNKRSVWDKKYQKAMRLSQNAKRIAEKSGVRNVRIEIRRGNASWEICELGRSINTGLIIIGNSQKDIFSKVFKENVTQQVIRNASNPVWIVKC